MNCFWKEALELIDYRMDLERNRRNKHRGIEYVQAEAALVALRDLRDDFEDAREELDPPSDEEREYLAKDAYEEKHWREFNGRVVE